METNKNNKNSDKKPVDAEKLKQSKQVKKEILTDNKTVKKY